MEKAEFQNKFIVFNKKHIAKLNEVNPNVVNKLADAITEFNLSLYKDCDIDISSKKYYVCNQDEPYSQEVIDIILTGEAEKISKKENPELKYPAIYTIELNGEIHFVYNSTDTILAMGNCKLYKKSNACVKCYEIAVEIQNLTNKEIRSITVSTYMSKNTVAFYEAKIKFKENYNTKSYFILNLAEANDRIIGKLSNEKRIHVQSKGI